MDGHGSSADGRIRIQHAPVHQEQLVDAELILRPPVRQMPELRM
jgi:hypothetical protein